ncbi:hypothetical protein EROM_030040 [Encephalitozoon romaleae SJ-2008]|uniref:Uncharacterized protein n=1 Tax=Encephalitozoon romaleae (strain SJ-2008) TaxID=1178016 RepID=I6ZHH1_ENCRO|nr:hypothetical protein EROM_030040 [Encephalitozoon romaleae SJ-2008]AFN82623.1 hypothetical protein EROM_030040 [Encephalitozoon romaleae SJ-2008]
MEKEQILEAINRIELLSNGCNGGKVMERILEEIGRRVSYEFNEKTIEKVLEEIVTKIKEYSSDDICKQLDESLKKIKKILQSLREWANSQDIKNEVDKTSALKAINDLHRWVYPQVFGCKKKLELIRSILKNMICKGYSLNPDEEVLEEIINVIGSDLLKGDDEKWYKDIKDIIQSSLNKGYKALLKMNKEVGSKLRKCSDDLNALQEDLLTSDGFSWESLGFQDLYRKYNIISYNQDLIGKELALALNDSVINVTDVYGTFKDSGFWSGGLYKLETYLRSIEGESYRLNQLNSTIHDIRHRFANLESLDDVSRKGCYCAYLLIIAMVISNMLKTSEKLIAITRYISFVISILGPIIYGVWIIWNSYRLDRDNGLKGAIGRNLGVLVCMFPVMTGVVDIGKGGRIRIDSRWMDGRNNEIAGAMCIMMMHLQILMNENRKTSYIELGVVAIGDIILAFSRYFKEFIVCLPDKYDFTWIGYIMVGLGCALWWKCRGTERCGVINKKDPKLIWGEVIVSMMSGMVILFESMGKVKAVECT